jgi:thiol-disulfide isomerase/thioredoxin
MLPIALSALAVAFAQESSAVEAVSIGQAVPPLEVEHWVQVSDLDARGRYEPITQPKPGTVYVVDFWATWCVPCIAAMDKVSSLQEQYADKGVRFVGITEESLPLVVRFLRSPVQGGEGAKQRTQFDRARFTLGVDADGSTAQMLLPEAVRGIRPQAAIIDGEGTLVWVGLPRAEELPGILDAVLDGTWDAQAYAARFERELARQAEKDRILAEEDWAAAREKFWDDADFLGKIAFGIAFNYGGQIKNVDTGLALEYATRANELLDGKNAYALHSLAKLAFDRGEKGQAAALQERAVEICNDDPGAAGFLDYYTSTLEQYRAALEDR